MPRAINRANILMGFEIEVLCDATETLRPLLDRIYRDGGWNTEGDASLRSVAGDPAWARGFQGIEVQTPPLPATEAIAAVGRLFEGLRRLQRDHRLHTNETCGFHVNVSHRRLFARWTEDERLSLAYHFLRRFDIPAWLEAFGRVGNRYAQWARQVPARVADLRTHQGTGREGQDLWAHRTAVNLEKLNVDPEERRIEVRCGGGADYQGHAQMTEYLNAVYQAFLHAARHA